MTGHDLKRWRKRLHMTQQQAADTLGLSRRGYQQMEARDKDLPRYLALACAAVLYDLPPLGEQPTNTNAI